MDTIIKNVTILTMNSNMDVLEHGYLKISGKFIKEIGMGEPLGKVAEGCEILDGEGNILMPGMCNIHTHIGMIPFRSLGDDCPDRLRRFFYPMEGEVMDEQLVYHSSRYAMAEMLLGGVTTFVDGYYFADAVAKAVDEMGCRALVGESIMPFPTCDSRESYGGLEYCKWFLPKWRGHDRIIPYAGPYVTDRLDMEVIRQVERLSEAWDTPISFHLEEMDYEMTFYQETFGKTPIQALADIGLLNHPVIAAHCIRANQEDIKILADKKVGVAHCIGSNTKAAKGVAPVKEMLLAGVHVGLGTDGPASGNTLDIITQFKLFADFHKNENRERSLFPASEIVRLGTIAGAKAIGLESQIGSLEPGKLADLVLVETKSVNMFPIFDYYSALVYSANPGNVDTVFVNGQCLVSKKKLVKENLDDLKVNLNQVMGRFKKEAKERSGSL